ncbi:WXG100 family type VII secretion target [Leucobacter sp. NPDC058333]|uniref:WXG100 family type VII secretion target n=1 Tax=Leucobacter sp. NPDC058333 TaxID=3346450 RepID=UPI0036505175
MSAQIDLHIPGDSSAIYALGAWHGTRVGTSIEFMVEQLRRTQSDVQYSWEGESVQAFHTASSVHATELKKLAEYLQKVQETLEAYADRLTRGKEHFAGYADEAAAAGMTVTDGRYISPPVKPLDAATMGSLTPAAERDAASAKRAYENAALLFEEIRSLVEEWNLDTLDWIETNFDPLIEQIGEFDRLRGLLDYFEVNGFAFVSAGLSLGETLASRRLGNFRSEQARLQEEIETGQKNTRSGHPARKELGQEYRESKHEKRTALERASRHVSWLDPTTKVLQGAGTVTDLVEAGVKLSEGEPLTTVAVGFAGGVAGGVVGAKAGASIGAQVGAAEGPLGLVIGSAIGAAAGGALGGLIGSGAAEATWETAAPLKVRDAIEEGLRYRIEGEYRLTHQIEHEKWASAK